MSLISQGIIKLIIILFYFQPWVLNTMLKDANIQMNTEFICFII